MSLAVSRSNETYESDTRGFIARIPDLYDNDWKMERHWYSFVEFSGWILALSYRAKNDRFAAEDIAAINDGAN